MCSEHHVKVSDAWLQRYLFMRGLIDHEKGQRTRHYLKSAAECTSRAVVSLELSVEPIKSVKQARKLEGIGGETCNRLTNLLSSSSYNRLRPAGGKFVSSAGAILVAMLEATEEAIVQGHSQDRPVLIPESSVVDRAQRLSEEEFINEEADGGFCMAWWRLEVLIKRGLIKRRSQKKAAVLQLLEMGKEMAHRLRGDDMERYTLSSTAPCTSSVSALGPGTTGGLKTDLLTPVAGPSTSVGSLGSKFEGRNETQAVTAALEDALYTNHTGADGLIMLVDTQEMGGDRVGLGPLCEMLGQAGICYKTRRLPTGDYSWVWRVAGVDRPLPCLVERKRADDVARTLKDGRFWSQINKMVSWKEDQFGSSDVECCLHYILERKPEEYVTKCADACQGVGRCGNPTLTQVKCAIGDMKTHPQLRVQETDSLEATVIILAALTAELQNNAEKGNFDSLLVQGLAEKSCSAKTEPETDNRSLGSDDIKVPQDLPVDSQLDTATDSCKTVSATSDGYKRHGLSVVDKPLVDVLKRLRGDTSKPVPVETSSEGHEKKKADAMSLSLPAQGNHQADDMPSPPRVASPDKSSVCKNDRSPKVNRKRILPTEVMKSESKSSSSLDQTKLGAKCQQGSSNTVAPRVQGRKTVKGKEALCFDSSDEEDKYQYKAKCVKLNITPDKSYTETNSVTTPQTGNRRGRRKACQIKIRSTSKEENVSPKMRQKSRSPKKDERITCKDSNSGESSSHGNTSPPPTGGDGDSQDLFADTELPTIDKQTKLAVDSDDLSSSESLPDLFGDQNKDVLGNSKNDDISTRNNINTRNDDVSTTRNDHLNRIPSTDFVTMVTEPASAPYQMPVSRTKVGTSQSRQSENDQDLCFMGVEKGREDKIGTILAILPQLTQEKVSSVLFQYGNNVELCLAALLEETSENSAVIDLTGPVIDLTD